MSSYPVWLWAEERNGNIIAHIGVRNYARDWQENAICAERVYGNQISHRCIVQNNRGEYCILPPTKARKEGFKIIHYFK